jgi:CHAD domain-containing protein
MYPARDGFKWLSDLTGTPRDLDVYRLEWSRYTDPLGADVSQSLGPVRDLLERRRADAHIELERALRSARATELIGTWRTWLAEPLGGDDLPPRAGRPLGRLVARRIARAHGILLERGRLIGPDTPAEQVHDLRKDAKRLRYLLECFGSLLPKNARKRYVKRLKSLQDNLGEHQDAEVHVSMLRAVAHELHEAHASPDTMVAIGQLTERLDQQRLAARAEFAARFADYDTPATQRALDAVLEGITE